MPTPPRQHERLPASALFAVHLLLSLTREERARLWARPDPSPSPPVETPPVPRTPPDDWDDIESNPRLGLSLAERVMDPARPPPDMSRNIREGVARILREQDDALGLNQPEVPAVARIVAEVARATGARHGSKAVFEIVLAPDGSPRSVTRDGESRKNRAWIDATDAIFARLQEAHVQMGPAAARAGAAIDVTVEVLHVYPHGTDWQFKFTDCSDVPKIEHVDEHGRPLLATFAFGLRFDIGSWGADKQLVVRTVAERRLPDFERGLPQASVERAPGGLDDR